MRDLEAKLNLLTTTTSSLQSDNERLKLMLQRAETENEILRSPATRTARERYAPCRRATCGLDTARERTDIYWIFVVTWQVWQSLWKRKPPTFRKCNVGLTSITPSLSLWRC